MKVTLSPQLSLREEYQYGTASFCSFNRLVSVMKISGEMREDAEVIGMQIENNGVVFIYKD